MGQLSIHNSEGQFILPSYIIQRVGFGEPDVTMIEVRWIPLFSFYITYRRIRESGGKNQSYEKIKTFFYYDDSSRNVIRNELLKPN